MSRLDDLIQKYCPNGVVYKYISDICEITRGIVLSKDYINQHKGEYPVYSSQTENNGCLGKIDSFNFDGEYITWTTDGANAGTVFFRNGKFNITNVCGLLTVIDDKINVKFLFYALSIETKKYVKRGMGNAKLMSNVMSKIKVPVPPIRVQEEIVRILDSFTKLNEELNEEFNKELNKRKKQYEYYRDKLLNFNDDVPVIKLKNLIKSSCSGATPKKNNDSYYNNGTIPWIRTQDVKFNEIYSVEGTVTEKAVQETGVKWINKNCVIIAMSGATAGRCAINKIKATTNQHCLNLEIDDNKAIYKYVYYCVCNKYYELLSKKQGARGDLNSKIILDTKIPVPSIDAQRRIIGILDKFEALFNDLFVGIPAEIEARKKQYEYYRDKLLTFKELKQ